MFASPPLHPPIRRSSSFSGTRPQLLSDHPALARPRSPSPPPSSRTGAVTIDHTAFPHIYENIMDQEPQENFSVFRRLNKWNALRFDRRMARHIGVCSYYGCQAIPFDGREVDHDGYSPDPWFRVRDFLRTANQFAPRSRHDKHGPVIFSVKQSKSGSRALTFPAMQLRSKLIPWDAYALDAATATWLSTREDLLSFNTQVLDIVGHIPKADSIKQKVWQGRNLHMIRFIPVPTDPDSSIKCGRSAEAFTADIGVVFARPRWFGSIHDVFIPVHTIVNTLVFHVDLPAGSSEDAWATDREVSGPPPSENLQLRSVTGFGYDSDSPLAPEIVYIFDKAWSGMELPQSSSGTPQSYNMFYDTAWAMAHLLHKDVGHSIVFVGGESLPPNVVDLTGRHGLRKYFPDEYTADSSFDPEHIRLAILVTILQCSLRYLASDQAEQDVAMSMAHNRAVQTLADQVLSAVHFKTRKEYRQKVGKKDWYRMTRGYSWQL